MHILLLIIYGTLASIGIWKIPFLQKSGIRPGWLWILFALHVLTGWVHNWIAFRYFPDHGDIWNYFSLSFLYRHRLLSEFNLFLSDNSTWTYITHNGIVFIQMLLDLLSLDDMNINTLLFSFPVFLGNVALFRVFRRRFPDDILAAASVFWLPSVLFWTSCIYREGMLYMLLGFLFYHLDRLFTKPGRRTLWYAIVLFLLIAYFRMGVAIILIPAILVWSGVQNRLPRPARWTLGATIVMVITLTLSIPDVRDSLLRSLATEQASFQVLDGHSRLTLPALDGTLTSVWRALPDAIRNGFFEPLPGSGGQPIYLAFSFELIFIWLIVALAAIRSLLPSASHIRPPASPSPLPASASPNPTPPTNPPSRTTPPAPPSPRFPTACLLFALAGMLAIGFFVPFAGTLVRYRSIYLPFLLTPAIHALRGLPAIQSFNRWLDNRL
jgi:hypothetical protein